VSPTTAKTSDASPVAIPLDPLLAPGLPLDAPPLVEGEPLLAPGPPLVVSPPELPAAPGEASCPPHEIPTSARMGQSAVARMGNLRRRMSASYSNDQKFG
jgi:hypothetical protein